MNMKKIILLCFLCFTALYVQAASFNTSAAYLYSSDFNQVRAGAAIPLGLNASIGLEGRYVDDKRLLEEDGFTDPVYSVYLPIRLDFDLVKVNLTPFYYFENKSDNALYQDATAYGVNAQLVMDLRLDEVNELYTQAYIGVSYANQQGTLFKNGEFANEDYSQLAYTLGLRQNFFSAFVFHAAASVYQYPNGIDGVEGFRGVMDQNDLAFTQSLDISRALGKYALSARITRIWVENRSSLYLAYHYSEFYTADPQHSFILGNTFRLTSSASLDAAYNHLRTTEDENKRDILFVKLNIAF